MPQKRGFAAMDERQRREIAAMGGRAAHEGGNAHEWNEREAAEAGRRGGEKVSRDRGHMAEIGRKGGLAAHHHGKQQATNGNGAVAVNGTGSRLPGPAPAAPPAQASGVAAAHAEALVCNGATDTMPLQPTATVTDNNVR